MMNNMKHKLSVLRLEYLQKARLQLLSGDKKLLPALNTLKIDANAVLAMSPLSVVDKANIPPSGDKHDFMSVGPYWWPDPAKKDGLPYIRFDGEVNPESLSDNYDRERFGKTMQAIETLALAYYFTEDNAYADKAVLLLRYWFLSATTRMNPHLQYGQAIPGIVDGRDIGIIDTRSLSNIVDAICLLEFSPALTVGDMNGMITWMNDYLNWLLNSDHGKGEAKQHNNHGTWYDVQVVSLACFTGRYDVAKQVLSDSATKRIDAHISADGSQPHELNRTRSWDYSVMNLDGICRLAEMGRHTDINLWHHITPTGAGIKMAIYFMAKYINQPWPYQQIKTINICSALPVLLRQATIIFKDDTYEKIISELPVEIMKKHRINLIYPK